MTFLWWGHIFKNILSGSTRPHPKDPIVIPTAFYTVKQLDQSYAMKVTPTCFRTRIYHKKKQNIVNSLHLFMHKKTDFRAPKMQMQHFLTWVVCCCHWCWPKPNIFSTLTWWKIATMKTCICCGQKLNSGKFFLPRLKINSLFLLSLILSNYD